MHNLQHDLLAAFRAWDGFRMNPATMSVELGAQQNISLRRSDSAEPQVRARMRC